MARRWATTFAFGVTIASASDAIAQVSGQDVATAQALFDEGKRLMTLGKYAEACPKLIESQRIDPGGGTLFAIALCHEGEGKTATAWAEFGTALAEARKDRRTDRESAAAEHVRNLEAKLVRVRILPSSGTARVTGLEIKRDGTRIGEAQWGVALPVDPGEHVFEATAPDKRPWRQVVDVRGDGTTVDVTVPPLEDAPKPTPAPESPAVVPPARVPETTSAPTEDSHQKAWAIGVGAFGLVASGVGLAFGASATSKWKDAERACPNRRCPSAAEKTLGADAGTAADLSTAFVAIGAVGVVAGVVLWLTAPDAPEEKRARALRIVPMATANGGGLSLGGAL